MNDAIQKCFTITVDSKKYGPFLDKYQKKCSRLEHKMGVSIETVWIKGGWVAFEHPKPPRAKKDTSTPLLDGVGFVPISKDAVNLGW